MKERKNRLAFNCSKNWKTDNEVDYKADWLLYNVCTTL